LAVWRAKLAALAVLPLLSGCAAAVALPLMAGGGLMAVTKHRVRAATQVPKTTRPKAKRKKRGANNEEIAPTSPQVTLSTLKELPPPSETPLVAADDRWQQFFGYAEGQPPSADGKGSTTPSALLQQPPSIDAPIRSKCSAPVPAVVIDLDDGAQALSPERLRAAPAEVTAGVAHLRQAGVVVLWISRLPSARAADVAQALRTSGLDPQGQDQLLLIRNGDDRKQLLREDASKDVCIVAIAGDDRGDFDELFDYLRNSAGAVGLYPLMGHGWFLVPSLTAPAANGGQ